MDGWIVMLCDVSELLMELGLVGVDYIPSLYGFLNFLSRGSLGFHSFVRLFVRSSLVIWFLLIRLVPWMDIFHLNSTSHPFTFRLPSPILRRYSTLTCRQSKPSTSAILSDLSRLFPSDPRT